MIGVSNLTMQFRLIVHMAGCRNILLVADGRYLTDGLKEFDHHSKVDEKAEHVLRDAEVRYCFECGEYRDFKCCHGCFQACCRGSAKVTDGTGGDD